MDTAGLAVEMMESGKFDRPEIYVAKFQAAIDTIQQQTAKAVANKYNGQVMALDEKIKKLCVASKNVCIHYINDGTRNDDAGYNDGGCSGPCVSFGSDTQLQEFEDKIEKIVGVLEQEFGITFPEIYAGD